mgnify:CR=1 FL=1
MELLSRVLLIIFYLFGCHVSWKLNVRWRMKAFSDRPWTWFDTNVQLAIALFSWISAFTGFIACFMSGDVYF